MLNIIVKQNYFQYEGQIFQPEKGIAMGSPISIAEIYLQYLENIYIKHWLDSKEKLFYKHHVDDILTLYEEMILQKINGVNKNLQFKMSTEANNTINYLYTLIHRDSNATTIGIYRKQTETDTVIHLASNHPVEHEISAFLYYINRLATLPITESSKQKEWKTVLAIARNNGYPVSMTHGLKTKQTARKNENKIKHNNNKKQ